MKKILAFTMVTALLLLSACGAAETTAPHETQIPQTIQISQEHQEKHEIENDSDKPSRLRVWAGDTVTLHSGSGNYNIRIDNFKATDWYEKAGGKEEGVFVGVLEYVLDNTSCTYVNCGNGFSPVPAGTLLVLDQDGFSAATFDRGYENGKYSSLSAAKGEKVYAYEAFILPKGTKKVTVVLLGSSEEYEAVLPVN